MKILPNTIGLLSLPMLNEVLFYKNCPLFIERAVLEAVVFWRGGEGAEGGNSVLR